MRLKNLFAGDKLDRFLLERGIDYSYITPLTRWTIDQYYFTNLSSEALFETRVFPREYKIPVRRN